MQQSLDSIPSRATSRTRPSDYQAPLATRLDGSRDLAGQASPSGVRALARSILADVERLTGPGDWRLVPEQLELLASIRRAARAVLDGLEPLEELESIRSGALPLRFETVDAVRLAREVAARLGEELAPNGQSLSLRCTALLPAVHTDPWRVQQVLSWIVRRAARRGGAGATIELDVRTARLEGDHVARRTTWLRMAVSTRVAADRAVREPDDPWMTERVAEPSPELETARHVARELGGFIDVLRGARGDELAELSLPVIEGSAR